MEKKEKIWVSILLIVIASFYLIDNYIVLSKDLSPIFLDAGGYIGASFKVYLLLYQHKFFDALTIPQAGNPGYPGLFNSLSSPFYLLFGLNQKSALMTNFIFILILIFSVYGIGKLLHSKWAGVLSAFIVMSFPGVFALSRTYTFDFALTAMVSFAIYCMLKTEGFVKKKFSAMLGLAAGLGIVVRPSFIIFFIGPFCYYLIISFRDAKRKQILTKVIKGLIIFLTASLFSAGFFYIPNLPGSIKYQIGCISSIEQKIGYFSLENLLFYLKGLAGIQIACFYFLLFVFCLVLFLKGDKKHKALLTLWFLIPYLFFTFYIINKRVLRFTAPYLPVIALIISISLLDIKKPIIKKVLVFLTVLIGLFQFISISHVSASYPLIDSFNKDFLYLDTPFFNAPALYIDSVGGRPHAYDTDYGVNALVDYFIKSDRVAKQNTVMFLDAGSQIARPLQYLMYQKNIDFLKKKEFKWESLRRHSTVYESPTEYGNPPLMPPQDTDFLIVTSKEIYKFKSRDFNSTILEEMKLVKMIDLDNKSQDLGSSLYIFEDFNSS